MIKVEAVVIRERVETVIDAVEDQTRHVGVTVVEAIGHGRQRGITHEYRGRVFESRFLPKAVLTFVVAEEVAAAVVAGSSDLKMPEPTKTPSAPSCMARAASAGVAIPPATKFTTGRRPLAATSATSG